VGTVLYSFTPLTYISAFDIIIIIQKHLTIYKTIIYKKGGEIKNG